MFARSTFRVVDPVIKQTIPPHTSEQRNRTPAKPQAIHLTSRHLPRLRGGSNPHSQKETARKQVLSRAFRIKPIQTVPIRLVRDHASLLAQAPQQSVLFEKSSATCELRRFVGAAFRSPNPVPAPRAGNSREIPCAKGGHLPDSRQGRTASPRRCARTARMWRGRR